MVKFRFQMLFEITSNQLISTQMIPLVNNKINQKILLKQATKDNSEIRKKVNNKSDFQKTQDQNLRKMLDITLQFSHAETQTDTDIKDTAPLHETLADQLEGNSICDSTEKLQCYQWGITPTLSFSHCLLRSSARTTQTFLFSNHLQSRSLAMISLPSLFTAPIVNRPDTQDTFLSLLYSTTLPSLAPQATVISGVHTTNLPFHTPVNSIYSGTDSMNLLNNKCIKRISIIEEVQVADPIRKGDLPLFRRTWKQRRILPNVREMSEFVRWAKEHHFDIKNVN